MEGFWKLLSDQGLVDFLGDDSQKLDEYHLRLILAEVLFRIQALENQFLVIQSLLVEHQLTDTHELYKLQLLAKEQLMKKDACKAREGELIADLGITPLEWINYNQTGKFNQ